MTKKEPHGACETCAKACDDAKDKVKKLEKSLHTMTIVMSVSLTLAGEQIIKNTASYISSFSSVMSSANELNNVQSGEDKNKEEKPEQNKVAFSPFVYPIQPFTQKQNKQTNQEEIKPYQLTDELARLDEDDHKEPDKPKVAQDTNKSQQKDLSKFIAQAALATNFTLNTATDTVPVIDPYAVFFTPSTLPFDVYSTTLALGTNYGFGEYYGMDSGVYVPPSVPTPGTITLFAFPHFLNLRKRA